MTVRLIVLKGKIKFVFYDKNKMNKHKFSNEVTENIVTRGSFLESFVSSLRRKMSTNTPKKRKN